MDIEKGTENQAEAMSAASRKPHDEFWGGLIIFSLVLGAFLALGFFAFLGYRSYEQRSRSGMSIADIPKSGIPETEVVPESAEDGGSTGEKSASEASEAVTDAKQTAVSVLNGGGAKGSAGVLADFLKKAGYAKVTAGNADGDYSGVAVFYQKGQESVAKSVLADVAKKYPKAAIANADASRKETSASPITVILGK